MGDYTSWKVGDKVVCVDAGRLNLEAGRVYTIKRIVIGGGQLLGRRLTDQVLLDLAELRNPHALTPGDYFAFRFRPVQKRPTSIEIFHRILSKPHIKIREDA